MLTCSLGEIADLSMSGMRVIHAGRPPVKVGQHLPLAVQSRQQRLSLTGRVVRINRVGLKRYEIGVRFIGLEPGHEKALVALGRYGFFSRKRADHDTADALSAPPTPAPYRVRDLALGATEGDIRAAYRTLAQKYHPDHNDAPEAAARFQAITEAYNILRDPKRRAAYEQRAKVGSSTP